MDFFYIVALLTAGVSLVTGVINLFIGLNKDGEKVDLVFGLMGLSLFIYFLIPPVGFILIDKAPYSANIDIKRLFMSSYHILFPWFLECYTRFKIRVVTIIINVMVVAGQLTMMFTATDDQKPLWLLIIIVSLIISSFYGLYLTAKQINAGEKRKGYWLLSAMIIYTVLVLLGTFNQLGNNYFGKMLGTKIFFPFNLNFLAFMLIMSIRLRANIFEKYRLEKVLRRRDIRWDSLVQNMQLLMIELDNSGQIKYLNPYAVKALGCSLEKELIGKNWFDTLTPADEMDDRKSLFLKMMKEGNLVSNFISHIITYHEQELIVSWTNVFVYDDGSNISGTMSIGLNITEQERNYSEIQSLKIEIEKEELLLKEDHLDEDGEPDIIGKSETILYAIQKARQVAVTNATVLLEGETGVGKELIADLIHKYSSRNNKTFIKINCAALPPELIESELFGHEKGSFTGAIQARKGRFELANGGTIFLDEIGELPLVLQSKLLRVLQNGEFERIGGQDTLKVDVRVISATNRDVLNEVKIGRFREDLYYRLNVFPITIPALRNRKEDIELLVRYFVKKFSEEHHKQIENISKADMIRLREYPWPGNIRELINVIERSIISSKSNTLKLDWINNNQVSTETNLTLSIEEVERTHILKVLQESNWKISGDDGAAVKLGLNPNTLRSRLKKLSISRTV